MKLRKGHRRPADRLRRAVEAMPRHSREAMLRGLDSAPIIAGAYADAGSGGICPMLAAHRNGGRTDLSSFARCWDFYTGARRPRLATEREVRTLRSYLEYSLLETGPGREESMREAAARIRSERDRGRPAAGPAPMRTATRSRPATGGRDRTDELRDADGRSWIRPTRRYDVYRERIVAASEQLAEQRASEALGRAEGPPRRRRERLPG
jgi:hypothetical protein